MNKRIRTLHVLVLLAAVLCAAACSSKQEAQAMLVFENTDTGQRIFQTPCYEGLTFSISFLHSVNLSDVQEYYEIRDGSIYLTACRYYAFGAGVATQAEEGQTLTVQPDGSMLLQGLDTEIPNLFYRFNTVYDYYLHIEDETYNLRELGGKNIPAIIYIENDGGNP